MNSLSQETTTDIKKVLLVDPDTRTRAWVALRMESMDIHAVEAVSATDALKFLDSQDFQLVITDWPLEGGLPLKTFFQKLNEEKRDFILFSQSPREEEGKWFVLRENRDQLVAQVAEFFRLRGRKAEPVPGPAKARQILIIEDSITLRGILRRALQKAFPDDDVREAEEGRQAFSQMSQKKVDLIITDLEMPGMDGRTFLNLLKTNPILSKKPVLVFSSNITLELQVKLKEMPNMRLLAKPADPAKVIREVSILLDDSRPA